MWFTKSKHDECKVCESKSEFIKYLNKEIDRISRIAESERAEYKRAIDRLLYRENIPPVGQGTPITQTAPNMANVLSLWDEVKEETNKE